MKIIPAINCDDFGCVREKLKAAAEFSDWVQLDIADGKFTRAPESPTGDSVRGFAPHKTWNNPSEISNLKSQISNLNIEVHLMVENPQEVIDDWIAAGAKRIIVHFEALSDADKQNPDNNLTDILNFILEKCEPKNVEVGLAIAPKTPVEEIISYLDKINFVQLLAVDPGLAGQQFQVSTLEKIKFLKSNGYADNIIEVDGGINLEMAKLCKQAGADILATASYIWNSENPKAAFEELAKI